MTKRAAKARYIKPETVCIGDTIRVTRKHKDVEISEVGKVAHRNVFTHSTEYTTAEGHVLLEHFRYEVRHYTVTLLDREADRGNMLPGMEI